MLKQYDTWMRDRMTKYDDLQQRYERIFKADESDVDDEPETDIDDDRLDGDADDERLDGDNGDNDEHLISTLADLMVEAGSADGEVTREDALQYLLHSERGQQLVSRMAAARKRANNRKGFTMNRSEQLRAVVKQAGGLGPLCQKIVKRGSAEMSEAELVGMITSFAKATYPGMDDSRAFSKMFCGPDGETLRRAVEVAKATQFANSAYPWPQR
jgi:hypothetical protein